MAALRQAVVSALRVGGLTCDAIAQYLYPQEDLRGQNLPAGRPSAPAPRPRGGPDLTAYNDLAQKPNRCTMKEEKNPTAVAASPQETEVAHHPAASGRRWPQPVPGTGSTMPPFLLQLVERELIEREQRGRRAKDQIRPASRCSKPSRASLSKPSPRSTKRSCANSCAGEYVDQRENVLLLGNAGTGKTHLATALVSPPAPRAGGCASSG